MVSAALSSIVPAMHIVCNLVMPDAPGWNITNTGSGLIASQFTPPNYTATLPDGYVAYPDVGAAYKIVTDTVTWKQARKLCSDEGARLGLIDSLRKLNHIKEKVARGITTHVGIYRFDGEWVSVRDGAVVKSIPWCQLGCLSTDANRNCLKLSSDHTGLYNGDCNDSQLNTYVCELPIPTS